MRTLIQRVSNTELTVNGELTEKTGPGLCVFAGFAPDDTIEELDLVVKKILHLRIFEDASGKMNLSVLDQRGEILVVSQFTLYASVRKGNRPSFTDAAPPDQAMRLYEEFVSKLKSSAPGYCGSGVFGADMKAKLVNDGPVTIWLDSADLRGTKKSEL